MRVKAGVKVTFGKEYHVGRITIGKGAPGSAGWMTLHLDDDSGFVELYFQSRQELSDFEDAIAKALERWPRPQAGEAAPTYTYDMS